MKHAVLLAAAFIFAMIFLKACEKDESLSSIELVIEVQNGRPKIQQASIFDKKDSKLPELQKGGSRYQIGLWQKSYIEGQRPDQLISFPELYLQQDMEMQFLIKSDLQHLTHISLHYMDGSSGHFTLKNTTPIQLISINP
jgi:hypothetical protein